MEEKNKRRQKRPYFTLLLISAIVYFFLAVIWRYFAPLIVAFLVLVGVEPGLSKWSGRLKMGRKPLAYIFLVMIIVSISLCVWFGVIPYLKCCDFSWCYEFLRHPWIIKAVTYMQEHGMVPVAEWSKTAIQITSKVLFNVGAYGLSVFLLAGVFTRLKIKMENQTEGQLLLSISRDVISYVKAYVKTQGKLFLIICVVCIPVLMFSGIQGGWLLGILAGVFDFFPVFGTGIILVPTALWQFLEKDYLAGLLCSILFIVCAVLREILEPKFLGQEIKLPSIGIWISIYAGIQLFGTSGIFKGPIGYLLICTIYRRIHEREHLTSQAK
jgi:predicted PurR-regulated permease PerM